MNDDFGRLMTIMENVKFPGYVFEYGMLTQKLFFVRVFYREPDVMSGVTEDQRGRIWPIPAESTTGQVVQTCFKAILTSLEHRAREHFLYRERPVMQPHLDIDRLWELALPRELGKPIIGE